MKKKTKHKEKRTFLQCIDTFSKWITVVWLSIWVEVVVFSEIATMFALGDSCSIQVINDNVKEIGLILCGFYFGKSAVENCFQGYEEHLRDMRYYRENYEGEDN